MQPLSLVWRPSAPLSHHTCTNTHWHPIFANESKQQTLLPAICLRFGRGNGTIGLEASSNVAYRSIEIAHTFANDFIRRNRTKNGHSRYLVCLHARGPVGFNQYYQLERERRTLGTLRPIHSLSYMLVCVSGRSAAALCALARYACGECSHGDRATRYTLMREIAPCLLAEFFSNQFPHNIIIPS